VPPHIVQFSGAQQSLYWRGKFVCPTLTACATRAFDARQVGDSSATCQRRILPQRQRKAVCSESSKPAISIVPVISTIASVAVSAVWASVVEVGLIASTT